VCLQRYAWQPRVEIEFMSRYRLLQSTSNTRFFNDMFKFIAPILACLWAVAAVPAPDFQARQLAGPPEFKMFVL